MQPRELQSISRLTMRVDSLSFISSLLEITLLILAAQKNLKISSPLIIKCDEPKSPFGFLIHRIRRFFVERSSEEGSPIPNNTPVVLNSTQLSGPMARETITISSVASLEPRIVTIDLDLNEPTFRYGFGKQNPIVPPNLKDLNLSPNPFNVLATLVVIRQDKEYSLQSPEPSDPSPISTSPVNLSTTEGWETPNKTKDDNKFYFEGERRRVYWHTPSN